MSDLVDQGLWLETGMASVSPKASEQLWQPQKSSARLEDSQNQTSVAGTPLKSKSQGIAVPRQGDT